MKSLRSILVTGAVAVLGASSALALTACSDDNVFGGDGKEVKLSVTERDLTPARVSVQAGEIEFVVKNDGDRLHAFAIDAPGGVERTDNIKPGETGRVTVDLSRGRYRMYDPRGGYRERGVRGTVVVTARDDDDTDTVTERTVERTVVEEEPDVDLPEVDDPELQDPEPPPPAPAKPAPAPVQPPPPTVTKTVPAPPPPEDETTP